MTYIEDIEHEICMADLAKYPFIAYVNPNEPQKNRDSIMGCGVIKRVVENLGVELGQVLIAKRTALELIEPPEPLKPIFENTTTCNECCSDMVKRTVEEQIKHDRESIGETIDKLQGKEKSNGKQA